MDVVDNEGIGLAAKFGLYLLTMLQVVQIF
jgi:hypothetical protein